MRMIKKSTSVLLAALMVLQLVVSPFTFAQTGEQQETPSQPELEVCVLPRQDYKNFSTFRLAYHAAIVDDNPVFAQDHFASMQDILTTHCSAVASIIQVQAEDLDEQCNMLVNHLVAKNNYYISVGRTDDAIATQSLIQTVLLEQDCAPIIQPASELAIDIVEQEVAANQTIDPALEVIPYKENVCFSDYGPSHTFRQQVENIQDPTVAVSVFDTVTSYFDQLGSIAIDAIQQQREGTLLAYAKNLLGFRQDALRNLQYKDHVLPFQIAEFVALASSMTDGDGIVATAAMFDSYMPAIGDYLTSLTTDPLRSTFAEPRMHNIFSSLDSDPLTMTRDDGAQSFSHETGERGLQITFPAIITQEPDPMDPAVMIDVVQQEALTINLLDVQGESEMVEITDDKTGEISQQEEYRPTKIVADLRYAGEKVTAVDISVQYDEVGNANAMQIAWYLDPYIYTNNYTKTISIDAAGNTIEHTTMDIRIFGPAGCDVQLAFDGTTTIDAEQNETADETITLILNNTRVEFVTQNFGDMWDDIQVYRKTVPTATSTPQTQNYLVDAKIYHKGVYRAYLYPESDTWLIGFPSWQEPQDFINDLWNPLAGDSFTHLTTIQALRSLLEGALNDKAIPENKAIAGCMDPLADNYNARATEDDGSCSYAWDGSGEQEPEPTPDPKPETGTGDTTPDPDAGSGDTTPQPGTGDVTPTPETGTGDEGGSGYQEIPWCTNPTADNYNADANFDDGSCTFPPAGPVIWCMNPASSTYNPEATQHDPAMCFFDEEE